MKLIDVKLDLMCSAEHLEIKEADAIQAALMLMAEQLANPRTAGEIARRFGAITLEGFNQLFEDVGQF